MPDEPSKQPIIVLACAYSGAAWLQRLLSSVPGLACTSATGILPLCEHAAATWRRIDDRDGSLSSLAATSIRALSSIMISVILARTGQPRWCEISFSPPASAETFLQLYPETRFVCLHRSCPNVIQSWIQANPWGLAGTSIGPFVAAYPGNNAAAIAAYWVEYTEQSLQFEQGHPVACRRVRHEDLSARSSDLAGIFEFLGLSWEDALPGVLPRDEAEPAGGNSEMDRTVLPHLIPRPLAERVNDLQACLGYQPLAP